MYNYIYTNIIMMMAKNNAKSIFNPWSFKSSQCIKMQSTIDIFLAQSAGAEKYSDCFSAEW